MKNKIILAAILLLSTLISVGYCEKPAAASMARKCVSIINRNSHYEVVLDFEKQPCHRKIGETYATQILRMVPNYEFIMDSYLGEFRTVFQEYLNLGTEAIIKRISDIKPQINREYRDEIEGMASIFSGLTPIIGDGKLSLDELYMLNLITDVFRLTQCSAVGVYGKRSATGKTIAARILDWDSGSQNQIAQLQASTTFKNGTQTICTIGYLGFLGVVTGLNSNDVFAGILDAGTWQEYSSQGKHSYVYDIRYALEHHIRLDQVGNYLKSPDRFYAFSHLVFLSDANICKVLENNISSGIPCVRDLRTAESALNTGIEWGIDNAVGCVNSLVLKGNLDTHTPFLYNTARWESMKRELLSQGNKVNAEQIKIVATYHKANTLDKEIEENLYNSGTQQIVVFEPNKHYLQVFFRPRSGILPETPFFEKVPLHFN